MPQFEGKGSKIVISNAPKFVQCGINRTICSAYEANTDPLNDVRDRLVNGIRYTKTKESDLKKIAYTIRNLGEPDDVNDYVSKFAAIKSDIIKSENANDWLIQYAAAKISKQCEAE